MKKLLCLLLTIVLLFSFGLCESETEENSHFYPFVPSVMNSLDDVDQLTSSSALRSLFTIGLVLDAMTACSDESVGFEQQIIDEFDDMTFLFTKSSYVWTKDTIIGLYLCGNLGDYLVMYDYNAKIASCSIMETTSTSDSMTEYVLAAIDATYWKNDTSELADTVSALSDRMGS